MKKFLVKGVCFVPMEAKMEVEAEDASEALEKAWDAWHESKRSLIVSNSEDEGAAHSWEPFAEQIGDTQEDELG